MKFFNFVCMILLVLSGLNWGLFTCFNLNLIEYVFGQVWIENIVYVLMGLSGIYAALNWKHLITTRNVLKR